MVSTTVIPGSDGKMTTMAPVGNGFFIEGKRRDIRVISQGNDEDLPPLIREALLGVTLSTIFSPEQMDGLPPKGSRIAYASEVAEALNTADRTEAATELFRLVAKRKSKGDEYPFLIFMPGEYEFTE